ncbi:MULTISPECIES: HK97 family phage prohead protease [unclassified Beijerinckia]|uniref:HK97 family phage prohead protease n=1 Tax=unclassified Beijerinckia TaxID=2638183 RepID=UPI000894299F|nr:MULTISPECIES: HK97 family phage prohead protease [unclassified Beijerinckia]MDH7795792.1 HK97 family phage prohead protease [Beijerinckia sp. GAS462]SEC16592.1 prohead peptidase. Unknown type peptidase. MEROPS family U35 [Beijerinckia sp. 28-YEA-48]
MQRLEFKSTISIDETGTVSGIAWPFSIPDRAGDMIEKGAFANTVAPIPMLFGHSEPIGVWDELTEKHDGLHVRGRMLVDEVARAKEARALVMSGAVGGLSIGFSTRRAITRKGGGRTIQALDLVEVSLVSVPCHPGARITSAKSAAETIWIADAINRAAAALR